MHSVSAGSGALSSKGGEFGRPSLAVGCFASICRNRLADELLAFSRICPEVDIGVHEIPRGSLLTALRAGELALAVLPGEEEAGTQSTEAWHDRVMVAMPHGHKLAEHAAVLPLDLSDQPILVSRQQFGSDMHRFLARLILPTGATLDSTIVDVGPGRLIGRVAAGEGVTLLCESHVADLSSDVVVRPVLAERARFPVRAYWIEGAPGWPLSALIDSLGNGRTS